MVFFLFIPEAGAAPGYRPGELIVKFRAGVRADGVSDALALAGVRTVRSFALTGARLVALPGGMSVQEAIRIFSSDPDVLYAEPNYLLRKSAVPNDTYYSEQWGLQKVDAPNAWDIETDARAVVIAVLDTGVDLTHPDIAGNLWTNPDETLNGIDDDGNGFIDDINGFDFANGDGVPYDDDPDGHGTHVAGIAAAVGNNGVGVSGMAWRASVMALKILDEEGWGTVAGEIAAIDYAVMMGARVINASFSYPSECAPQMPSLAERDAIERAMQSGTLFIAAAGNQSCDNDVYASYPAGHDLPNVLSVSSGTAGDTLSWYSNYGAEAVHVAAPGDGILSTVPGAGYAYKSGTSMSVPHVTGLAALLFSHYPGLDHLKVKETLLGSVDKVVSLEGLSLSDGRLNARSALSAGWPLPYSPVKPSALGASVLAGAGSTEVEGVAAASASGVTLVFTDNSSNEEGFQAVRAATGEGSLVTAVTSSTNVTTVTDTGAPDGMNVIYYVRAFNSYGESGLSLPVSVTTPLNPPSGLTARAVSDTEVVLAWDDNSVSEEGYRIERAHEGGGFVLIAVTGPDTESFRDAGLITDDTYRYRAWAFNPLYSSTYSNEATVTVVAPKGGGGGCFVATAAWGDADHPMVKVLRRLRDEHLLNHASGRGLVALYYRLSPPVAEFIGQSAVLRASARAALTPVAAAAALWMHPFGAMFYCIIIFAVLLVSALTYRRKRHLN